MRRLGPTLALVAFSLALRPAELPELPKLNMSDFLPAVHHQIQDADAAARAHPQSAEASGELGMVLDTYQQYDSAAVCYERARRLDARSFRWAYYLGTLRVHQGNYGQAAVTLREALRLAPAYLPARLKLAESLLATGNLQESGDIYKEILKRIPQSDDGDIAAKAEALYGMGRVEAALGQTAAAAESYRKACGLFPAYGAAQYALALAYRKLGEPERAEPHFRAYEANTTVTPPLEDPLLAAVQALSLGAEPHLLRSVELEQQGRLTEAIAEQEQALVIDPHNVQANINLISLYARHGEADKAEQHYQAAERLNPNRADSYYNHGVLLLRQGKYSEAEQAFRHALEINPFYAEAHNNLGILLERQGRTEGALAEYEASLDNQPNSRLAHYHIGKLLVDQKKYDEGIEHLLKTLAPEDESTPSYLYALAIAYGRKGNRETALKYAHRARDQAAALHQSQLLAGIDRDLRALEQEEHPQ
jgi:tetratricopeptide (TPR) repeat protein